MHDDIKLHSVESAIQDIKNGKLVIVVDDHDRENEGDFITAARNVTPEIINFMATHGRGLICAPLVEDRCNELGLDLMVENNTTLHSTRLWNARPYFPAQSKAWRCVAPNRTHGSCH